MKKYFFFIALAALLSVPACNEKPSKGEQQPAQEVQDTQAGANSPDSAAKDIPQVNVEKAAPTEDGKDHTVAEFATSDCQVKLENLSDGTYRLTTWKAGQDKSSKPERVVETKKCVMNAGNYLMKADDGKIYVINAAAGSEEITIMDQKEIIFHSK